MPHFERIFLESSIQIETGYGPHFHQVFNRLWVGTCAELTSSLVRTSDNRLHFQVLVEPEDPELSPIA